ncbi:similar to Saccharomyces cerevisiae YER022W SRB4 Subunit of the RNA polymerase II mediator complex [Maudiozyma saulgeensis]|uniref:Mediator of RNA polymerase II transcription subunit 17 n=1 Tax=Maudiozyma saulgeensis TaxID=1789683 RepID=A0A1X7R5Z0_9SACH|nr:similar to Saccharomyces cerevisiae YER022W SRB4 Subunit of the RNA polymerase II mediator complex [Kazachstania saulgeensis]
MSSPNLSNGINLALDPNLLSLHKNPPQSTSPTSFTGSPITNESTSGTTVEQPNVGSLVNNPYEQYGNMPLPQLVPLILQQKQMTFAQLLESQIEEEITDIPSPDVEPIDVRDGIPNNTDQHEVNEDEEVEQSSSSLIPSTEPTTNKITTTSTVEPTDSTTLESIRSTMVEQINTAMNESSLALETVSLLLSAVRENNAKSSLSPYLKRTIPMGSLNGDRVNNPPDIETQLQTIQFGVGWKLKSLDESRTILRDTAESLWSILAKEHSYWKMISEVVTNSDVVFKVRERGSAQRVLGIKYGYEDSGSTYRLDRGVALLRNNEELNKLELVPFSGDSSRQSNSSSLHNKSKSGNTATSGSIKNMIGGINATPAVTVPMINHVENGINDGSHQSMKYFLRVRIFTKIEYEDDYILSGESNVDPKFFTMGTIRSQIHKFKDIIFEKELMYQLKKECSSLISYGVRIENENKITIELPQEKFEIELVSVAEDECEGGSLSNGGTATRINDKRANLILITLRILLVVVFKKNLKRRLLPGHLKSVSSHISTNNSSKSTDGLLLIRPILGTLRHQNYKTLLLRIIRENVLDIIKDSSITVTKKRDTSSNQANEVRAQDEHIEQLDQDIQSFNQLLKMPITQLTIVLPKEQILRVTLRTTNYCNAVIHVIYEEQKDNVLFDTTFTEFKEIEEFLHFLINEYVIPTTL